MREDLKHFIDTSMGASEASYELLGDGIESLTEEMNPEEESKQYINMSKASNSVKSYQRTFDVDKEDCIEDNVQKWMDGLVDKLPTGAKAKTSFVRMRLRDAVEGSTGIYRAIKVPCTVSVTSNGGDGGDYVHNVISVKQCGEDIEGTFNISTKTFTPESE
ncbi:MAG: phage tail tube protein [Lachnospiraceae bacterium]